MILTPLQLACIIALILIVCGTVTWLVTMHVFDKLQAQIDPLKHNWSYYSDSLDAHIARIEALEKRAHPSTLEHNVQIHATGDDPMALWDAIINTERKRSNRT